MSNSAAGELPLSEGAKKALMKLALMNSMDPSMDGHAWCGPYGAILVKRGLAVRNGRDGMGFQCFKPTAAGKTEGLRLFRATSLRPPATPNATPEEAPVSAARTPVDQRAAPTRAALLSTLGRIQNLAGVAGGAYENDRALERAAKVRAALQEIHNLCVDALAFDPPPRGKWPFQS